MIDGGRPFTWFETPSAMPARRRNMVGSFKSVVGKVSRSGRRPVTGTLRWCT